MASARTVRIYAPVAFISRLPGAEEEVWSDQCMHTHLGASKAAASGPGIFTHSDALKGMEVYILP